MKPDIKIEMPMGLGMSLAQNPDAMRSFAAMTKEQQMAVIEKTHSMTSRREMHEFVNRLGKNGIV